MNTLCHCEDCHALFDESKCSKRVELTKGEYWGGVQVSSFTYLSCPECGSAEVGDAETHHVLAQLDDVSGQLKQAIKERNEAQMQAAGAFQIEARMAANRLEQLERELAAYKRHIAEMEVRP